MLIAPAQELLRDYAEALETLGLRDG